MHLHRCPMQMHGYPMLGLRCRRNHGFKMACIGGFLTGGLVGAAGAAGIWGISKAYTSFKNNKKENDEIIEVTL